MLGYRPLCGEKNEIRLVTILPPTITKGGKATEDGALEPVQCVLEHLSLDDYSPGYADFLATDALALPAHLQHQLWKFITRQEDPELVVGILKSPRQAGNAVAQSLAQTLPVLASNPKYQDKEKYNESATRWEWGDYDALSYVWGDPTITRKIIVNGHEVNVTENLEAALRSLQCRLDDRSGRRLWIDALCINQTDILERNVQVKRMATIYNKADTVIAWLGCETDASKSAFRFIRKHTEGVLQTPDLELDFIKAVRENPGCLRKETWKGLTDLICLPYWSRAWIIQEIELANTDALLVWGSQECLLAGGPIMECGERLYRAAGDSKHDHESDGDESHLVCKGLKFDTIGGLGCDMFSPGNVVPSRITLEPANPYTDDEGIRTALWGSFLLGRMTSLPPHVATFLKSIPWLNRTACDNSSFIPFYGSFDRFQQYNRTLEIAGKSLEYYFPEQSKEFEITPRETWDIGVDSALFNSLCPMGRMRLMTTRKGYVGFAPKLSQRGDIICVLQGCNIPVVLRPCGEIYNLVGECYIHGIMEGETVVGLEKGEYELETITLC
ncbi:uncharacterized protein PAC_19847 [Phialocephala subalpina]|uniref:Heterokaryon incompatibility domain-containing protein n=1 Tax=Phialocephala subalpina TaxID=576137 RepID=A0A1L7XYA1_9HELO|nr:uncharacterized protein PAC_19847 [Phialocephala subalpina]